MGLVERENKMQNVEAARPGRSRDLFGVQLEVTSLLLEGERRKLAVLQRELQVALAEGGSVKAKEKQRQELLHAISKIQGQHEQLDKEYRIHAAGVLLCNSRGCGKVVTVCGLGRILGYIGGRPSVGAAMSQSGSVPSQDVDQAVEAAEESLIASHGGGNAARDSPTRCRNGSTNAVASVARIEFANGEATVNAPDLTNGFENRTMEYERYALERALQERGGHAGQPLYHGTAESPQLAFRLAPPPPPLPAVANASARLAESLPITAVAVTDYGAVHAPRTVSSLQEQSRFARDAHLHSASDENRQYALIRAQFEGRCQIYPQDHFNDPSAQYAGAPQAQLAAQSVSPQPPHYLHAVVATSRHKGCAQFAAQPQRYPYGQYGLNVMSSMPCDPRGAMCPPPQQQQQQQQQSNPQRFSQDLTAYQSQSAIVRPIARNVGGQNASNGAVPSPSSLVAERPNRGPKPMVPPRGNSKITHDQGHRKSASVDVSSMQKQTGLQRGGDACVGPAVEERAYLASVNQNPRTRQDGLYVPDAGEERSACKSSDATDCPPYAAPRTERRKSISLDVSSNFQRRNDTITFTFPGDVRDAPIIPPMARKTSTSAETSRLEVGAQFPGEQRWTSFDPGASAPPVMTTVETLSVRQDNRSPCNQRSIESNRRSDCFDEQRERLSPPPPLVLDGKRLEEVVKSSMSFAPRDAAVDRAGQKSPSFVNQAFEKTRQELAIWAEQRQRQEVERGGQIFATSPRSRNQSEERRDGRTRHRHHSNQQQPLSQQQQQQPESDRKDVRLSQSAFQPIPNITQSTIVEQRRHLRHVSADLTKHVEPSRKDFDDQPIIGSVVSLVLPAVTGSAGLAPMSSSQRASPNLSHQFAATSEARLDATTKSAAPVVPESIADRQVDHIIHSHRKSHGASASVPLARSKSQAENLQTLLEPRGERDDGSQSLRTKANWHQPHQQQQQQQMQNQQSLDVISEKLCRFERQQSDLQAKLQCLQSQNQILDKVAQFQHQQSDLQARLQSLQVAEKPGQFPKTIVVDASSPCLSERVAEASSVQPPPSLLHQSPYAIAYQSVERLSPRPRHDAPDPGAVRASNAPQQSVSPSSALIDRNDSTRNSLQYRLCQTDKPESAGAPSPCSLVSSGVAVTGTLKKVPPEKPPRTSLIVQSPEAESNRSQPAIGLKQTPKARPTIFGTVASDLNPKEGNSRRSLPQTPAGGATAKGLGGGGGAGPGPGPGMVNGATADHRDIRDGASISAEHALVYRDGNLVSGCLEALVQHMVPTEDYYPDRAYLFAFLLSARLFIKPHELLGEVCALCEHQQNLNGEGGKERLHRFVPRLLQLLAEWTETFPYDFRDERVMSHVRSITQKVAAVDAAARQEVSALLKNLLLRLTALERYEEGLARLATDAAAEQLTQVDVTELCPSATVLAQQLTHVELERLSYIGPEEFVQAFAKESPHLETSFKDMKKTRNLESYVQWFNRLSYFVATEVCKHAKKKQRVRVVEYWIETARECFNIGNFNSLMAIIAGLNMSPISRLKKTWAKVQSAKFSILEHQMDPSSNFSSYRSTLKAAMWRSAGATDERQRIVVPFFSLLVKDLYFLNEGCSNKLPNGHINFEKFWQLAKQVTEFIAWKQVACPFEKNSRVIAFLQASPVLTENALALASFECEPPDNNPEKERYKALKSEMNAP